MRLVEVQITPKRIHAKVAGTKRKFDRETGDEIKTLKSGGSNYRWFILPDSIHEK